MIAFTAPAIAQPSAAGRIDRLAGTAVILRAGKQVPLKTGDAVLETDVLRTGPDGRIGVTLKDDTRLALGPGSEVRLEKFAYAPGTASLGMVLKFVRGVTAYVSGRLAKLAPDAVRLETPSAIVAMTVAERRKTIGSANQIGSPVAPGLWK